MFTSYNDSIYGDIVLPILQYFQYYSFIVMILYYDNIGQLFLFDLFLLYCQHNSMQTTPIKQQPSDRRQILKPLHQPIISQPRTITIARGNTGLGMSLACDAETDSIVVKNILSGSAVGRDGRIRISDCIIAINHESLEGVSLSQAK